MAAVLPFASADEGGLPSVLSLLPLKTPARVVATHAIAAETFNFTPPVPTRLSRAIAAPQTERGRLRRRSGCCAP